MRTDLDYLKTMSGEDPKLMAEMIDIFRDQVIQIRKEMQEFLNNEDYSSLGKLAHKAKTSVAIMGMDELADQLRKLEIQATQKTKINSYQDYVNNFRTETEEAINELIEFKNKLT